MEYTEICAHDESTTFWIEPQSNRICMIIERAGREEYAPTLYLTPWQGFMFWLWNRNIVIKAAPFFNKNAENAELRAELKHLLRMFPKGTRLRASLLPPVGLKLELLHFDECSDMQEAISETKIEYFPL